MHVPMPLLAAAAVIFLLLVWLVLRPRGGDRDLLGPPYRGAAAFDRPARHAEPTGGPAGPILPPDVETEVRGLVRGRRKIEAIKRVREATGMGLADAKDFVERM